jgi:hypothetical protein
MRVGFAMELALLWTSLESVAANLWYDLVQHHDEFVTVRNPNLKVSTCCCCFALADVIWDLL